LSQKLCKRNLEVRKVQKIHHTGGAKLLFTKQHEMVIHHKCFIILICSNVLESKPWMCCG